MDGRCQLKSALTCKAPARGCLRCLVIHTAGIVQDVGRVDVSQATLGLITTGLWGCEAGPCCDTPAVPGGLHTHLGGQQGPRHGSPHLQSMPVAICQVVISSTMQMHYGALRVWYAARQHSPHCTPPTPLHLHPLSPTSLRGNHYCAMQDHKPCLFNWCRNHQRLLITPSG